MGKYREFIQGILFFILIIIIGIVIGRYILPVPNYVTNEEEPPIYFKLERVVNYTSDELNIATFHFIQTKIDTLFGTGGLTLYYQYKVVDVDITKRDYKTGEEKKEDVNKEPPSL